MGRFLSILMPVEWVLVVCGVLTALLYQWFGIPMPGEPGSAASQGPILFYIKQILVALDLYCLVLAGFAFLQLSRFLIRERRDLRGAPWRTFGKHLSTRLYGAQIAQDARFMNALLVMFIEFGLLKNLIPLVNSAVYDEWFIASDALVCGGAICSQVLHSIFGQSPEMVGYVSSHYFWYYSYMILVAFLCIVFMPRRFAQEYLCAFVILFLIGRLVIDAAPTWGPVYARPELFAFMRDSEIGNLQRGLWDMKLALDANGPSREAIFMISGFPSLHVAVVTLGSLYVARVNRWLAVGSWIFVVLTWNSTLYLGWHYLLDDVGAVGLVFISQAIARRLSWRWWGEVDYTPAC